MPTDPEGGLDLSNMDEFSDSERAAFTEFYLQHKGKTLPGHEFWIDQNPGAFKRYRRYAIEMNLEEDREYPQVAVLCWLHFYAVIGFEEGIAYQIHNAQARGGSSRKDILATLHAAFLHSGPLGTLFVAAAAGPLFEEIADPEPKPWPPGWSADDQLFQSGLDFDNPGLTADDQAALTSWYERVCGEVPPWVSLLAQHNPDAVKAYRMRFEHAAAAGLPSQMFALVLLQWELTRATPQGVRDAMALARGVGLTRSFVVDAITRAMVYAGPSAASVVASSAADILGDLPSAVG